MHQQNPESFVVVSHVEFSPEPRLDPGQIALWHMSDNAMQTALRNALAWYGPNGERWHHGPHASSYADGKTMGCIWYAAEQFGVGRAIFNAYRDLHSTPTFIGDFNADPTTTFADVRRIYSRAIELAA